MSTAPLKLPVCTAENYRQMVETAPRHQLVEGDLHAAPTPSRRHQEIARNLLYQLLRYLEERPLGVLYPAPLDVYLDAQNVFQPDVTVVLEANRGILRDDGMEGPPDLVVEILSPRTRLLDLDSKRKVYGRCGVKELWLIDPEPQRVDVYLLTRSSDQPAWMWGADALLTSELLPGFSVPAGKVFAR